MDCFKTGGFVIDGGGGLTPLCYGTFDCYWILGPLPTGCWYSSS